MSKSILTARNINISLVTRPIAWSMCSIYTRNTTKAILKVLQCTEYNSSCSASSDSLSENKATSTLWGSAIDLNVDRAEKSVASHARIYIYKYISSIENLFAFFYRKPISLSSIENLFAFFYRKPNWILIIFSLRKNIKALKAFKVLNSLYGCNPKTTLSACQGVV